MAGSTNRLVGPRTAMQVGRAECLRSWLGARSSKVTKFKSWNVHTFY